MKNYNENYISNITHQLFLKRQLAVLSEIFTTTLFSGPSPNFDFRKKGI